MKFPTISSLGSGAGKRRPTNKVLWEQPFEFMFQFLVLFFLLEKTKNFFLINSLLRKKRTIITTIISALVPRGGSKTKFPTISSLGSGAGKRRPTNKVLWEQPFEFLFQFLVLFFLLEKTKIFFLINSLLRKNEQ